MQVVDRGVGAGLVGRFAARRRLRQNLLRGGPRRDGHLANHRALRLVARRVRRDVVHGEAVHHAAVAPDGLVAAPVGDGDADVRVAVHVAPRQRVRSGVAALVVVADAEIGVRRGVDPVRHGRLRGPLLALPPVQRARLAPAVRRGIRAVVARRAPRLLSRRAVRVVHEPVRALPASVPREPGRARAHGGGPVRRRRRRVADAVAVAIVGRDARHVALLAHEPGVAHAATQRVVVGAVRGAERVADGADGGLRRLAQRAGESGRTLARRGDVVARPAVRARARVAPLSRVPAAARARHQPGRRVERARPARRRARPRRARRRLAHASGPGVGVAVVARALREVRARGGARAPASAQHSLDGPRVRRERGRTRAGAVRFAVLPGPALAARARLALQPAGAHLHLGAGLQARDARQPARARRRGFLLDDVAVLALEAGLAVARPVARVALAPVGARRRGARALALNLARLAGEAPVARAPPRSRVAGAAPVARHGDGLVAHHRGHARFQPRAGARPRRLARRRRLGRVERGRHRRGEVGRSALGVPALRHTPGDVRAVARRRAVAPAAARPMRARRARDGVSARLQALPDGVRRLRAGALLRAGQAPLRGRAPRARVVLPSRARAARGAVGAVVRAGARAQAHARAPRGGRRRDVRPGHGAGGVVVRANLDVVHALAQLPSERGARARPRERAQHRALGRARVPGPAQRGLPVDAVEREAVLRGRRVERARADGGNRRGGLRVEQARGSGVPRVVRPRRTVRQVASHNLHPDAAPARVAARAVDEHQVRLAAGVPRHHHAARAAFAQVGEGRPGRAPRVEKQLAARQRRRRARARLGIPRPAGRRQRNRLGVRDGAESEARLGFRVHRRGVRQGELLHRRHRRASRVRAFGLPRNADARVAHRARVGARLRARRRRNRRRDGDDASAIVAHVGRRGHERSAEVRVLFSDIFVRRFVRR